MKKICVLLYLMLQISFSYCQDGYIEGKPALAYWQMEKKSQLVIMLHGGPGVQHQYLRPEFDELNKVAKVIYYDQRGCGKSEEAESYAWQEQVGDLKRVIQTFSKGQKVILVGSSWGSTLAMIYAYTYPQDVKGLILSGTVEWWGKGMNPQDYLAYKATNFTPGSTQIIKLSMRGEQLMYLKGESQPKVIPKEKNLELYSGSPSREPRISFVTAPVMDSLSKIQVPVLIFVGDKKDCKIEWGEHYHQILPNSELFTIKDACHDPWFTDPEKFFERSKEFINTTK